MKLPTITRRTASKIILAGITGSLIDGFLIEPNIITTNEKQLHLPLLPPELDGLTIVQLTDFHYDPEKDHNLLEKVITQVNALNPDIIALTGDYIDHGPTVLSPLLEHLKKLKANHAIIAIMGNHDGWNSTHHHIKTSFEKIGIQFLINQNTILDIGGNKLAIAGTDFIWLGRPDIGSTLRGIPAETPILALVHEPDFFDTITSARPIALQLSGHTHGGQCRVPLIRYAPNKVKFGRNYIHELYKKQNSRIFVSQGIGTTGIRVRFACPPEIAHLTLRSTTEKT